MAEKSSMEGEQMWKEHNTGRNIEWKKRKREREEAREMEKIKREKRLSKSD